MGAYFQTSFSKKQMEKISPQTKNHIPNTPPKGVHTVEHFLLKFLETHYFGNFDARYAYQYIADQQDGCFMATVCDYDNQLGKFYIPYFDNKVVSLNIDKDPISFTSGLFVCDETSTFFDFAEVEKIKQTSENEHDKWLISPLHLLTRLSTDCMGGGDICSEYLSLVQKTDDGTLALHRFHRLKRKNMHIGAWYNKCIRFIPTECKQDLLSKGFDDITNFVCYTSD